MCLFVDQFWQLRLQRYVGIGPPRELLQLSKLLWVAMHCRLSAEVQVLAHWLGSTHLLAEVECLHPWPQTLAERNKAYESRQEDQEAMQVVAGAVLPQEQAVA